jgi:hypothetical protein
MPFVSADWTIGATGDIRYIGTDHGVGSPSYATVIELHRALQDFADDASSSGDDLLDITKLTPSERSTDNIITLINGYNIDDTAAEHLFDGSIVQDNGATIYDGIVNFGNAEFLIIVQNGAILSDSWWNAYTPSGFNASSVQGISHRFLIKVRASGADIDGRRILGLQRDIGSPYTEFSISSTSRGNNVLALSKGTDLNNQTSAATLAGFTDVVNNTEGYVGINITGFGNNFFYSNWDLGSRTFNQFYERIKWLTRRGSTSTLYGLPGSLFRGITHEIVVDGPTGTFAGPELLTWTGGSGQLIAINSNTAATKVWIQLLTGVVPTDNLVLTGVTSAATVTVNVTVTTRSISIGGGAPLVSTGTAIIGPYGLGIEAADLTAAVNLTDLDAVVRQPPNNVTFTVAGLVSGEDRVLVGPESGGVLQTSQFTVSSARTAGQTTVPISITIPSDTPASGTIRLFNGTAFDRVPYSSYTGSTFTVTALANNIDSGAAGFISYIDTLAGSSTATFTSVFLSSRPLFVRVRDGQATPIKTFETTATLGSAGGGVTVIRTTDV